MQAVDEQGRIFGLINIIDLLVILGVVAVVVGAAAFVFIDDPDTSAPTSIRYVTLDLGPQPAYVADLVTEGDIVNPSDTENITITDVYVTGTDDGQHVYARAEIVGERGDEGGVTYADEPLRVGRDLDLTTTAYQTSGTITAMDTTNPNLPVEDTDVLLRTTLPAEQVEDIQKTDKYRVSGETVGTVRSVTAYRTDNPGQVRAYVGVTYRTYRSSDGPRFAGVPVREGVSLPLETEMYSFEGEVVRRGVLTQRGSQTTHTVQFEIEDVDPDTASALRTGMAERVRGETIARLTNAQVSPATVVLTSQDGNIYRREHPTRKDVTMTADLRVRETASGLRFKGEPLSQGRTLVLDFGSVTIEATVSSIQ